MATDIEKLFADITNGLDLLKPQQVQIVAAHLYRQQVEALTKEALEDFKDRSDAEEEWEAFHARTFRQEVKSHLKKSSYESVEPEVDRPLSPSAILNQLCYNKTRPLIMD